jgi:hypothetical protein
MQQGAEVMLPRKPQHVTILTGESRRTQRKICPSATLSTINPIWIYTGANPVLRGERPATNRLSHAWHGHGIYYRLKAVFSYMRLWLLCNVITCIMRKLLGK